MNQDGATEDEGNDTVTQEEAEVAEGGEPPKILDHGIHIQMNSNKMLGEQIAEIKATQLQQNQKQNGKSGTIIETNGLYQETYVCQEGRHLQA